MSEKTGINNVWTAGSPSSESAPPISAFEKQLSEGASPTFAFDAAGVNLTSSMDSRRGTYQGKFLSIKNSEQNTPMNPMTREEMTAHLEAAQAKSVARVSAAEAKTEARLDVFGERIDRAILEMREATKGLSADMKESARGVRIAVYTTGIGALIGIVGVVIANTQTMIAAYDSGHGAATANVQVAEQLKQTSEQVKQAAELLKATQQVLENKANSK